MANRTTPVRRREGIRGAEQACRLVLVDVGGQIGQALENSGDREVRPAVCCDDERLMGIAFRSFAVSLRE